MKKNIIKLNENTLRHIVAESVKKVLKEYNSQITPELFKEQLMEDFESTLLSLYEDVLNKNFKKEKEVYEDYMYEIAEEMAHIVAESLTNDSMRVLNSNNWDVPKNNFRPLGFVMNREHNVHNFQELLSKPNPVDIYTNWFWGAFGTFAVKYKFSEVIGDLLYDLEEEEED